MILLVFVSNKIFQICFRDQVTFKGNVDVHWYAKKIDHYTPMFNDTVLYRHQHAYHKKMANVYFNRLLFEGEFF